MQEKPGKQQMVRRLKKLKLRRALNDNTLLFFAVEKLYVLILHIQFNYYSPPLNRGCVFLDFTMQPPE